MADMAPGCPTNTDTQDMSSVARSLPRTHACPLAHMKHPWIFLHLSQSKWYTQVTALVRRIVV